MAIGLLAQAFQQQTPSPRTPNNKLQTHTTTKNTSHQSLEAFTRLSQHAFLENRTNQARENNPNSTSMWLKQNTATHLAPPTTTHKKHNHNNNNNNNFNFSTKFPIHFIPPVTLPPKSSTSAVPPLQLFLPRQWLRLLGPSRPFWGQQKSDWKWPNSKKKHIGWFGGHHGNPKPSFLQVITHILGV